MIPFESLITPTTSDGIFEKLLDVLETVGVPARSWREGSVARSMLGVVAEVGYQGASIVTASVRGGFLLFGAGDFLRAHAKDVYDVDYIQATYATGSVTLSNAGGLVFTIGADELVVRSSVTKKSYRITEAFVLPPGGSVTVSATALEPGSGSSAAPGEIDELETPLAKVTVTNASSLIGRDDETDEALVARCLAKKGTWSPFGPRDAYEYAALSATLPDTSPTSISRVAVQRTNSTGTVRVVCATPSGTPSGAELDAVEAKIEEVARPDTVTCIVEGAVPLVTSHDVILWCKGGTEAILLERAQDALDALISTYPIGGITKTDGGQGYFFADKMAAALIASSPEVFDVDGVGADIPMATNEVVTNTTTITVRIR